VKIALGVTGCIAAYKAIEIMRGLQKAGVIVQVVLTRSAAEFVTPLTFESLSAQNIITEMFPHGQNQDIRHISIAQSIQMLAVAPATANIIGKFAHGIADDFLSTLYLSCPAPVLIAPAMNVEMWDHPAVQENVAILKARGHRFVDPEPGRRACGMEGEGRLAPVERIVEHILEELRLDRSMSGWKVLVTAGPTVEDVDPIRFMSNRSSGKMGYAIAKTAMRRGAEVFLVSGPTGLPAPDGVKTEQVRSAVEMKDAVLKLFPHMDVVVKAAAVADYCPTETSAQKSRKRMPAWHCIWFRPKIFLHCSANGRKSRYSLVLLPKRKICWSVPGRKWGARTSILSWPTTFLPAFSDPILPACTY